MKKFLSGMILTIATVTFMSVNAFAAGSVSASGDKDTAVVGDTYTVSVSVKNDEGAAIAPDVSVNYDVNRLSFVSCSGEYGGGAGGYITLGEGDYTVSFTILSGGQADVDVNAIFDGDGTTSQIVTATVMVDGEDTAAVNDMARDMGTGIEASSVGTPDGKVIAAVFADEFMPAGFVKTTVSYEEQMVEAAQFSMGNIVLLYVTDADGNNGGFRIYDQATGELKDFLEIQSIENRFIIVLTAGPEVEVPDDFQKAQLMWNEKTLEAYAYTGKIPENMSVNMSEFFLLYAISSEGNTGWYMYDQNEGTYQRYIPELHSGSKGSDDGVLSQLSSVVEAPEDGGINVMLIIVIALAVLLVALIVTVIIMAVKLKEFNSYDYIDEDEEDETAGGTFPEMVEREERVRAVREEHRAPVNEPSGEMPDEMPDEMPKSRNIYEDLKREDEMNDVNDVNAANMNRAQGGFASREEYERDRMARDRYERYGDEDAYVGDDSDLFSPRERKLTRDEKKMAKAEAKARKKEEKRLKKEFGEFGPVDWQSWQDAVDGGDRTAAMAARGQMQYEEQPMQQIPQQPMQRRPLQYEEQQPKSNPMDMMRGIPANDDKRPVQAKPIQQFDFDDDFEFEFLDLDDDE